MKNNNKSNKGSKSPDAVRKKLKELTDGRTKFPTNAELLLDMKKSKFAHAKR